MEYKLGNNKKIIDKGTTNKVACPNCGKKVCFSVFSNRDTRLKAGFPLFESNNISFVVCPECASVFGTRNDINNKKDLELIINPEDLINLQEFNK